MKTKHYTAHTISALAAAFLAMGSAQAQTPTGAPLTLTAAPNGNVEVRNANSEPIATFTNARELQLHNLPSQAGKPMCALDGVVGECDDTVAVGQPGPQGEPGPAGPKGADSQVPGPKGADSQVPGAQGPRGFKGCYLDLSQAPAEDTSAQLCVKGQDGQNGQDGTWSDVGAMPSAWLVRSTDSRTLTTTNTVAGLGVNWEAQDHYPNFSVSCPSGSVLLGALARLDADNENTEIASNDVIINTSLTDESVVTRGSFKLKPKKSYKPSNAAPKATYTLTVKCLKITSQ